jgi:hypothetical protein
MVGIWVVGLELELNWSSSDGIGGEFRLFLPIMQAGNEASFMG